MPGAAPATVRAEKGEAMHAQVVTFGLNGITEEQFRTVNLLVLRNTMVANVLDRCAISIPCHCHGDAPVGLMLVADHGADRRLFQIAAAVEQIVSPGAGNS